MNEENQFYQLTCYFSPLLDQSQLGEMAQNLKETIAAREGLVLVEEELAVGNIQRKKLAYPIQNYQEAFCLSFNFLANSQSIAQLNNQFNLNKNILRHMIVAKQKPSSAPKEIIDYKATEQIELLARQKKTAVDPKQKATTRIVAEKSDAVERESFSAAAGEKDKEEKTKIDELDKKLEEILNQ